MWLSAGMENGLSTPSRLESLLSLMVLGSQWNSQGPADGCWEAGVVRAGDVAWMSSEQCWAEDASRRLTPSSERVISGSLARWQMVKPSMPEVRGEWWQATLAQLAGLQGLIIIHQDTPIWSELGDMWKKDGEWSQYELRKGSTGRWWEEWGEERHCLRLKASVWRETNLGY